MPEAVFTDPFAADERTTASTKILLAYVFLLFSRILEMLNLFGLENMRLMLVVSSTALLVVFITGNITRAIKTEVGALLIALTMWMLVAMPFSSWRSETLNQFLNNWLKSLMVFVIVAGLAATIPIYRRLMRTMGWAAAASVILVLPGAFGGGERLVGVGTLSNPNEIAFHLWLGMPFLIYLITQSRALKKIVLIGFCGFELLMIMKTVSREGMLLAAAVGLLTLFRVSMGNKMKIILISATLVLVAAVTLPREAIGRYMTLFSSNVNTDAAQSAALSAKTRTQKLQESVELTLKHPIFGVGMGVFMPASVELTKAKGGTVDWQVSHNSYTQVSSELGFPGFFLLLALYASAFRQLIKAGKRAKAAGKEDARQIAFALLLALVVLSIHFCFDSMAYMFYLPLLMALITAFTATHAHEIAENFTGMEPSGLGIGAGRDGGQVADAFQPAIAGQWGAFPKEQPPLRPAQARNPYRIGRKRTHF
jgi:O-antigen ligase